MDSDLKEILETVNLLQKKSDSLFSSLLSQEVLDKMTPEERDFIEKSRSAFKINGENAAEKLKDLSNLMERHGTFTNIRNV